MSTHINLLSSPLTGEREFNVTLLNHKTGAAYLFSVCAISRTQARFKAFSQMDQLCLSSPNEYGEYCDWHVKVGFLAKAQLALPFQSR